MKAPIQIGDFVKDVSFDPPEKGHVLRVDEKRPNGFIVKMASGGERSISARNLEMLEQKTT